jgi:hypothetical protein
MYLAHCGGVADEYFKQDLLVMSIKVIDPYRLNVVLIRYVMQVSELVKSSRYVVSQPLILFLLVHADRPFLELRVVSDLLQLSFADQPLGRLDGVQKNLFHFSV